MAIPSKTTLRTAWKESPAVIRAMGDGKHFLLLSRVGDAGRERESRLLIRHLEFFLFPRRGEDPRDRFRAEFGSYLEGARDNDGNQVTLRYRALVTEAVMVMEGTQVAGLSPFHIWTDDFLRSQIQWDPRDPAFAVTCKVQRVDPPIVVPCRDEYGGPSPWVTLLDRELPVAAFESVLENAQFLRVALDVKNVFAEAHKNPLEKPEPEPTPAGDGTPAATAT